jgi:DNA modification methylase
MLQKNHIILNSNSNNKVKSVTLTNHSLNLIKGASRRNYSDTVFVGGSKAKFYGSNKTKTSEISKEEVSTMSLIKGSNLARTLLLTEMFRGL